MKTLFTLVLLPFVLCGQTTQPATEPADNSALEAYVTYKGKPKSKSWFEKQYQIFKDRFVKFNGKFYPAGNNFGQGRAFEISVDPPIEGTEFRIVPARNKVFQLITEKSFLVEIYGLKYSGSGGSGGGMWYSEYRQKGGRPLKTGKVSSVSPSSLGRGPAEQETEFLFFVDGWDENIPGVDKPIEKEMVYVGQYTYKGSDGSRNLVQSYIPAKPLTKEEFSELLNAGQELKQYFPSKTKPPKKAGNKRPLNCTMIKTAKGLDWYRVISKPVN